MTDHIDSAGFRSGIASDWIRLLEDAASVTRRDRHRRLVYDVKVPAGMAALRIIFRYEPGEVAGVHNLLTVSVFGPNGFRGAAHRWAQSQEILMDARRATPGFLPGAISAGTWRVEQRGARSRSARPVSADAAV